MRKSVTILLMMLVMPLFGGCAVALIGGAAAGASSASSSISVRAETWRAGTRAEGRAVFEALLDRFATIESTEADPPWRGFTLRGLERLPVRVA